MTEKDLRFLEFGVNNKKLFIVKHHAVVIKCWKKALNDGIIRKNSNLFHIDKHPDFNFDIKNEKTSKILLRLNDVEVDNFIQKNLAFDNSEFIVNAMFSELIKDCVSIHFDHCNNCHGTFVKESYSTTNKYHFTENSLEHNFYVYETQNLLNLFGYQSLLSDSCIHQDTKTLFSNTSSLILDVDLDFFTYSYDGTYAKNKRDIIKQITSDSFNELLDKAKIITIALEPTYCGSDEDCLEILELFSEQVFRTKGIDILNKVRETFFDSQKVKS